MHCRKTGGSSCAAYLNQYIGPYDIQVGVWDECLELGARYNKRFYRDVFSSDGCRIMGRLALERMLRFRSFNRRALLQKTQKELYQKKFDDSPAHPAAATVFAWAPQEWREYYKFGFVRNPYDLAVSDYKWRTRGRPNVSFTEYLERLKDPSRPDPEGVVPRAKSNWEMYTIDDKSALDFIGKYEQLLDGIRHICDVIGLPFDAGHFPHAKKTAVRDLTHYRDAYNDYQVSLVSEIYAKEIREFSYSF